MVLLFDFNSGRPACENLIAALIPDLTVQTHIIWYKIAAGKVLLSEQVSQQESHQDPEIEGDQWNSAVVKAMIPV